MQIIFVRHGESEANAANGASYQLFTGQFDCDLTAAGRAKAEKLHNSPIFDGAEVFFVSDLIRAVHTAEYFADPEKTVYEPRIRERSLGEFEGRSVDEVKSEPKYQKYFTDPEYMNFRSDFIVKAPGGESYTDVCRRVRPFLDEILAKNYKKIVIVSHIRAIQCMMRELRGLSEDETRRFPVPTCEPIIIEV